MLSFLALTLLSLTNAEVGSYIKHNVSREQATGDAITIHIVGHTHDDPGDIISAPNS